MESIWSTNIMISAYRISIRKKKWYWCIFYWLLDLTLVNAWFMHQYRKNSESGLPLTLSTQCGHVSTFFQRQTSSAVNATNSEASDGAGWRYCSSSVCCVPFAHSVWMQCLWNPASREQLWRLPSSTLILFNATNVCITCVLPSGPVLVVGDGIRVLSVMHCCAAFRFCYFSVFQW